MNKQIELALEEIGAFIGCPVKLVSITESDAWLSDYQLVLLVGEEIVSAYLRKNSKVKLALMFQVLNRIDWTIDGKVKNINHSEYGFDFIYADKNGAALWLIGLLRSKCDEIMSYIEELEHATYN